jgi:hypothetical protein
VAVASAPRTTADFNDPSGADIDATPLPKRGKSGFGASGELIGQNVLLAVLQSDDVWAHLATVALIF